MPILTVTTVMLLIRNAKTLIARQKAEHNQNKIMQIIENQSIGLTVMSLSRHVEYKDNSRADPNNLS